MARKSRSASTQATGFASGRTRDEIRNIETYSSPKTRETNENAGLVFSGFLFSILLIVALACGNYIVGEVNVWVLCVALVLAILAVACVHVAPQWERVVILRLGKFNRQAGPGLYFTIPFLEQAALHADQRLMITGFGAEETLTADLVPVNVDAAVFWMVWDAKKACLEVEDYYDSVSLAAQTTLRDAIGRKNLADITTKRNQLDEELRDIIEDRASVWGISILSVEIRDIVIPKELQQAMSVSARADREKDARIVLAEVEQDIASMLAEASEIYAGNEIALRLRQMHLVNQSLRESQSSLVVPSSYADGFVEKGRDETPAH